MLLVPQGLRERERVLLKAIAEDRAFSPIGWSTIETTNKEGDTGTFYIFSDALRVPEMQLTDLPVGDHRFDQFRDTTCHDVRICVSANTAQQIADALDCSLPTAHLLDQAWLQRGATVLPCPLDTSTEAARALMMLSTRMVEHSLHVQTQLDKLDPETQRRPDPNRSRLLLIAKHWILDQDILKHTVPNQACNYGWFYGTDSSFLGTRGETTASLIKDPKSGLYVRLIQGRGFAHDISHADYSQVCQLISNYCLVNGKPARFPDLLGDPRLSSLVTHNGPYTFRRHPNTCKAYVGTSVFGGMQ